MLSCPAGTWGISPPCPGRAPEQPVCSQLQGHHELLALEQCHPSGQGGTDLALPGCFGGAVGIVWCLASHLPVFSGLIHSFSTSTCVFAYHPWWSLLFHQLIFFLQSSQRQENILLFLGMDSCLWLGNQYTENKSRVLKFWTIQGFFIPTIFTTDLMSKAPECHT